jgi:hypothetical protein
VMRSLGLMAMAPTVRPRAAARHGRVRGAT